MNRLSKTYEDGTHGVSDEWSARQKSYVFKDALIESVGKYEDLGLTPDQIREVDRLYAEKCREVAELKKSPWIPVTERLPKCEEEVYIQTKNGTMTTAAYEDGKIPEEKSKWRWDDDVDFDYDEESDTYLVPEGWWEYRHFNPDEVYNNVVDEEVVAWMPLPEPYTESVKL